MKYTLRSAVSILLLTQALGYVSSSYAGADNLAAIERAFNTKDNRYLQVLIKQSSGFDSFIAQYRLAMSYQIKQDIDNSKKVLEQLLNSLVPYTENNPADMEAKALLANVYGLSIALNPSKAESYGPLSFSLIEQALKQAPHKPIVLFFKASLSYYTPTMYGGSKVKAHATLKKALNAYSGNLNSERYWGHDDALVLMGLSYLEKGKVDIARGYWNEALLITPEHAWANYLLQLHKNSN